MATDNFDSFAETCERFGNIAQYDAAHLDVVGAFHRLAELHKREVDSLNFKLMTAKSEQKTAANVIIEQTNKVEKLEREIAELRECLKDAVDLYRLHLEKSNCMRRVSLSVSIDKWRKALKGANHEGK